MILLFILIVLFSILKTQVIIIPFKTKFFNELSHENFMSELVNNKIYIELKIGTPYQKIPVLLKLGQVPFFITSSIYNKDIIKFNSSKSTSYTQEANKEYQYNYDYTHAYLGEDIITIENISNKDLFLNRTEFFLAINLTQENENVTGEIGLNIIYPYFISFLNQLKNKKLIKDYIFSIKYINENEGEFHLGNYYHLYENNLNYDENDFKSMKIGIPRVSLDKWILNFDEVILSTGNTTYLNYALLSYEFGFIYGTWHYYGLINEIFFTKYEKNCEKKNLRLNDFYYVCDNNIDLGSFPDLIFIKDDFNFTLTKNELWTKFDNKYYFLVIFCEEQKQDWVLGKIFFQKYIIFFNQDTKTIGFYQNYIKQSNQETQNDEKKFEFQLSWILVILLFILLILTIIIYIIYYYLKVKKRKIRVNELSENYEYVTEKNNNNEPLSLNND